MPERQKSFTGTVVSDKMEKTVIVLVQTTSRHRLYRKTITHSKRYLAHDDRLEAKSGDLVRIVETRPLSRHKRWRVVEIVQRGEVAEIAPKEIDADYITRARERETPPDVLARMAAEAAGEQPAAKAELAETEAAPAEAPSEAIEEAPAAAEAVDEAPSLEAEPAPADEPQASAEEETEP